VESRHQIKSIEHPHQIKMAYMTDNYGTTEIIVINHQENEDNINTLLEQTYNIETTLTSQEHSQILSKIKTIKKNFKQYKTTLKKLLDSLETENEKLEDQDTQLTYFYEIMKERYMCQILNKD
jgi:hypothetical protein